MPKAILEFQLPEEQSEYELCNKANDYYCVIFSLYRQIRTWSKDDNRTSVDIDLLQSIFYDTLEEYGIEV
jgi:hypothetical protein